MVTLENDFLRVVVNPLGAELCSLVNKQTNLDYMWNGDPAFWGKQSPVLFPIVGTLKENRYGFEGRSYHLGRHGFAREKLFEVHRLSEGVASFELKDDAATQAVYPFKFHLSLLYEINKDTLSVSYIVSNRQTRTVYFSIGGHPAFKVPLGEGLGYDDYFLEFNKTETVGRWPISSEGLIEKESHPLPLDGQQLPLHKSLFYNDAIVLKHLKSDQVTVKSGKHSAGLQFSFPGFPYLGIWAAKEADFVCIEPWCGIADSVDSSQQITEKDGIIPLEPGARFKRTWSVTPF